MRFSLSALAVLLASGCSSPEAPTPAPTTTAPERPVEARSLLDEPLYRPELGGDFRQSQEELLAAAQEDLAQNPGSVEAIIWTGRRTAYLGRYGEAIEIYSQGLAEHPDEPRLYRHRGHRQLTLRDFDAAIADFSRAAELIAGSEDQIEPDGLPNDRGIPTSTLQSNIWYHLGLAHYLEQDFEKALDAYRQCLEVSKNPDMLVATSHWLYMTMRRLDQDASEVLAPISAEMDIIENQAYHQLLLMYRGERDAEELLAEAREGGAASLATTGYGIGNWYLYEAKDLDRAMEIFREIVATDAWPSFGYIAAEAELAAYTSAVYGGAG